MKYAGVGCTSGTIIHQHFLAREAGDKYLHATTIEAVHLEHRGIRPIRMWRPDHIAEKNFAGDCRENENLSAVTGQDLKLSIIIEVVCAAYPVRAERFGTPAKITVRTQTLNATTISHKEIAGSIRYRIDLLITAAYSYGPSRFQWAASRRHYLHTGARIIATVIAPLTGERRRRHITNLTHFHQRPVPGDRKSVV